MVKLHVTRLKGGQRGRPPSKFLRALSWSWVHVGTLVSIFKEIHISIHNGKWQPSNWIRARFHQETNSGIVGRPYSALETRACGSRILARGLEAGIRHLVRLYVARLKGGQRGRPPSKFLRELDWCWAHVGTLVSIFKESHIRIHNGSWQPSNWIRARLHQGAGSGILGRAVFRL